MARTFSSNVLANGILQFLNLAFPILLLPFLAHVLSPEAFGAVNFFSFLVGNFSLFVQYGFEYSATRKLTRPNLTQSQRESLFNEVMSTKLVLAFLSVLIYLPILLWVPDIDRYWPVALATFAITFGFALNPMWYVLGVQEMPRVVWRHLIPKTVFIGLVFLVVRTDAQAYRYPALIALAIGTSSLATWHWIVTNHKLRLKWVGVKTVVQQIQKGFFVFGVSFLSVFYQTIGAILLGQMVDYASVGTYTLGWRIMNLFPALALIPILQALFPRIGEQIRSGKYSIPHLLNRTLSQLLAFLMVLLLIISPWVPGLLGHFFDPIYAEAFYIFLSFIPFILLNTWNQVIAHQLFLNLSKDRLVFIGYVGASVLACLLSMVFIPMWSWKGVLIGLCGAEVFLAIYNGYQALTKGYFRWIWSEWTPKAWLVPLGRIDHPPIDENPSLSLVIPTFLRPEVWPPLLQSIRGQTLLPNEIVVIDQNPDHNERQAFQSWLQSELPGVHWSFPQIERPNRCLAKQMGLLEASGPIKVVIDDDVVLHPEFIEYYRRHLQSSPWDLLTTQLLEPGVHPEPKSNVARYTWYGYFHLNHHSNRFAQNLNAVTGACFGFFHNPGIIPSFEPNLIGQGIKEEVDFTYTMAKQGYRPVYRPEVPTQHFPQQGGNRETKANNRVRWMAEAYYNFGYVHQKHALLHLQLLRSPYVFLIGCKTAFQRDKMGGIGAPRFRVPGYILRSFWRGYRRLPFQSL